MKNMKKMLLISVHLVILLIVIGCGSTKVLTVPLANVSNEGVKLHRSVSAEGVAIDMGYNHPYDFSHETLRNETDLLVVRKFEWGKYGMDNRWVARPVFPRITAEKLIPVLVIAFKEASISDKILFNIPGRKGLSTLGEVYLKDNELVWIFKEIDGVTFLGKDPFMLDGKDWTIEEKPGLTVKKKKDAGAVKVIRDLSVKPEITAEITGERLSQPPTKEEALSPDLDGLEKKLNTLKKWKDSSLISNDDYEKEKDLILQQLQEL